MTPRRLFNIYFSATDTTRRCVEAVASTFGDLPVLSQNLADKEDAGLPDFCESDVVIVGVPVYCGRVPQMVTDRLKRLRGNNATAVAMVVYGNRDYDDALLELVDTLEAGGFRLIGGGAFIGQHSIFPKVGGGRPDSSDLIALEAFAKECKQALADNRCGNMSVKGARPYKKITSVPLHPSADKKLCSKCGECVSKCPAGAIAADNPALTDNAKCISCGRCMSVCPLNARRYSGIKYSVAGKLFVSSYSGRKEPEWSVAR